MRYTSTRSSTISSSFEEALCQGYAPDDGLFVPTQLPTITPQLLQSWTALSYPELTLAVLRPLIAVHEVSDDDLRAICVATLAGFTNPDHAVPVVQVGPLHVAELFHGPTFCFKDFGLQFVVRLLNFFLMRRQQQQSQHSHYLTILVSTTGDTGPAAVQAVADVHNPHLSIVAHFPHNQISDFQRQQLLTTGANCNEIRVRAFPGSGDDMDRPIKNLLSSETSVTGVNSYNIARPLMQAVHFVWTYLRVCEVAAAAARNNNSGMKIGDPMDVILPTGAMGNVAGGYLAQQMGLPIAKFVLAVNVNDITHRVVQHGTFHRAPTMHKTMSDAINIQVPYNFERILLYLTHGDHDLVRNWMTIMDQTGQLTLPEAWTQNLQGTFASARVDDDAMCDALRQVQQQYNYLCDPHTAVAFAAAQQLGYMSSPRITTALLATASPCKFGQSLTAALGESAWNAYRQLDQFPAAARAVLCQVEPPLLILANRGSLESSQQEWEENCREEIARLQRKPYLQDPDDCD